MGQIIIITGVSCAGKSTLLGNIAKNFSNFFFPISLTTRALSERDKASTKKYSHVSEEHFLKLVDQNHFLEYEKVHKNYYGTPKRCLMQAFHENKDIALDIDPKGAVNLLKEKKFNYKFIPKGFFVWRDIHPLSDFKIPELSKVVGDNIRLREKGIDEYKIRERVVSASVEYQIAKNNQNLFTFIENKNGNLDFLINEFSKHYLPGSIS